MIILIFFFKAMRNAVLFPSINIYKNPYLKKFLIVRLCGKPSPGISATSFRVTCLQKNYDKFTNKKPSCGLWKLHKLLGFDDYPSILLAFICVCYWKFEFTISTFSVFLYRSKTQFCIFNLNHIQWIIIKNKNHLIRMSIFSINRRCVVWIPLWSGRKLNCHYAIIIRITNKNAFKIIEWLKKMRNH